MKIAIVYSSVTGNTKLLAETIKNEIGDVAYIGDAANAPTNADLYFVGSWTNRGDASKEIIEFLKKLKHKKIAYFATAGYGGSVEYYNTLFSRVKEYIDSTNSILKSFFCQGKMPLSVKERYVKMITENPDDKMLKVSLANFEEALTHPDSEDLDNLRQWVKEVLAE